MKQLRHQNVAQLLAETAARFPDRPAIQSQTDCWTYTRLLEETERMAGRLLALGIVPGSHVAFWTEPDPQSVTAFFAVQRLGAVAIMLNTCLKGRELKKQLRCSDAAYLILEDTARQAALIDACRSGATATMADGVLRLGRSVAVRTIVLSQLVGDGVELPPPPEPSREKPAMLLFTSGTTSSEYKVVCSSGVQLANSGRMKAEDMRITETDIVCCVLPMFHTFCINCNILASAASGACLVLPPDRHSKTLLSYIRQYRCTILTSVPSVYLTLVDRARQEAVRIDSLRCGIVGGAYCPPDQFRTIERELGMTLLPGLGQTEVIGGITIAAPEEALEVRATTLGHFVDRLEGRIWVEPQGAEPDNPGIGEIQVRGPMVMLGYYRHGRIEPVLDEDGWFHTGDLGWSDPEGNIHYAGRIKDLIIRGGENIMPSELEQTLSSEPRVACCKAVGVPDSHYGEVPCMCIVPRQEAELDRDTVLSLMSDQLAGFKLPKYVLFFQQFPYTSTGKINCKKLAAIAEQKIKEQG